ncbi:putative polysaccharide biosynthesis protein [Levilactobacillus bambusae]|uniref:Sugar transporter n=1 Tax=Levilactobacillus bambusae TaxID=2024736 RepID=A0A2V1MYY2_9LACO|nr:polysaccharide biosynthesis protein [Levilactobacillus bambusae]PWF99299.1 sugar transporter [Levilactobacillus bambusae]
MQKNSVRTVMRGAMILSVAALFAKVLSAVYRVPFQNMVGNTGFYVYQQIYPIYGIGMTFALNGLPVLISKLIAEAKDDNERHQIVHQALLQLEIFSVAVFLALYFGANGIAREMGDTALAPIIMSVAWMFLFMPFLSVARGYYQGQFNMVPTAVSQLVEQVVRVVIILGVAVLATRMHWSPYVMGAMAMSSAAIAAAAASITLWRFFRVLRQPYQGRVDWYTLGKRLLVEGGIICLFSAMMVLLQLVDSFTVKTGLVANGLPDAAAKAQKGIYDRGQPLVQLGLVIATSFSASLLPALAQAYHQHHVQTFVRVSTTLLRVSLTLSAAATTGMVVLMPQINTMLFSNGEGDSVLAVYVLSILLSALITTYNSVLQSLNQFRLTLIGLCCGLLVKAAGNAWAVRTFGIVGASWMTVASLLVILGVIWFGSDRRYRAAVWQNGFGWKLTLICGGMGIGVRLGVLVFYQVLAPGFPRLASALILGIMVPIGAALFLMGANRLNLLTIREWLTLPLGDHLVRLGQRLKKVGK